MLLRLPASTLLMMLFSVANQAQQKAGAKLQPPIKPKAPAVNCSEKQTSKACGSFKQLLDAHDKDIQPIQGPASFIGRGEQLLDIAPLTLEETK